MNTGHLSRSLLIIALASVGGFTLRAQVPDGSTVVSSFATQFNAYGGLYVVDSNGTAQPIRGLPPELVHANCVLRDPRTGHLLVGTIGMNATIWLFELSVRNLSATVVRRFNLGTTGSSYGGVNQAAWLPDGRLIFCISEIVTGPTLSQSLWILDLADGRLVAPNMGTWVGQLPLNSVAVAPDGRHAYVAFRSILEVPLFDGGTPQIIARMHPFFATGLCFDCNGALVAATTTWPSANDGRLYRHTQSPSGSWTSTFVDYPAIKILQGVTLDPVTCDLLMVSALVGTQVGMGTLFRLDPMGALRTVTTGPQTSGWGSPSGVDIDPNPELFGTGTAAASGLRLSWQYRPFAAGAPKLGNRAFQLVPRVDRGTLDVSMALIGLGRARPGTVIAGLQLLVDPAQAVATTLVRGPSPAFPLPIPNDPVLVGLRLHAQAFGTDASQSAASTNGLTFTVSS